MLRQKTSLFSSAVALELLQKTSLVERSTAEVVLYQMISKLGEHQKKATSGVTTLKWCSETSAVLDDFPFMRASVPSASSEIPAMSRAEELVL